MKKKTKTKLQNFTKDQLHYIAKGKIHRKTLKNQIREALTNNRFDDNFIISSRPGLGKTFEMQQALKKIKNPPLMFNGSSGIYGYFIDVATAIFLSKGRPLVVINDDCDMLFDNKNINVAKKMLDDTKILRYGKNYRSLKSICTPLQWEALESFSDPAKAGLDVDVSTVTFITMTNQHFNTIAEVDEQEKGSSKFNRYDALYAIRRRTNYKEIAMIKPELWGYVADVVLNERICEKFMPTISQAYKHQILQWCYERWDNRITERNLSVIEKMTKDIVRYPNDYLDIWEQEYATKPKK